MGKCEKKKRPDIPGVFLKGSSNRHFLVFFYSISNTYSFLALLQSSAAKRLYWL